MAMRSALKKIRLDTFSLNYESRVVIENAFALHFWGAHAARVYCSAARRTVSWRCAAFGRLPLKFVIHHCTPAACAPQIRIPSRELLAKTQSAQTEKHIRHHNKH
jgi:hypothetical protein